MDSSSSLHPYVKLSQTPLAQQTNVCGIPAKPASFIVGLFALIVVSGSHFGLGYFILQARPEYVDPFKEVNDLRDKHSFEFNKDNFMENAVKNSNDRFTFSLLSVFGGLALFCGIVTAVTGIILLASVILVRPAFYVPWFIAMVFSILFGRIFPLMASIFMVNEYTKFFAIMAVIDIVTLILVVICWGQLAGVYRRTRYMNWTQNRHQKVKIGGWAVGGGLPPGSYPRQY